MSLPQLAAANSFATTTPPNPQPERQMSPGMPGGACPLEEQRHPEAGGPERLRLGHSFRDLNLNQTWALLQIWKGLLSRIKIRELLTKVLNLGSVVEHDVGLTRMQGRIILVIRLGWIEALQRDYLGHDRTGKNLRLIQLRNVGFGNPFLLIVGVENRRAILGPAVRTLPVQLRGIVGHGEKHPQQLAVGNFRRIVNNLHRFGVAGLPTADHL